MSIEHTNRRPINDEGLIAVTRSRPSRAELVAGVILGILIGLAGHIPTAHAEQLDLREFAGKVIYLDFWASWCVPCRQSFPWLNDIQVAYANRGLVVVAVNLDKEPQLAAKFLEGNPAAFRIVYDPKGAIATSYDVKAMPSSVIIGRDGQVRTVHRGFHEDEEYNYVSDIKAALGKASLQ
jgi:thiol-disulfide isomerase/thioredoxin